ncbi:STAS domain-containing protein [Vibrio ouci]|uniref:STAS domain-containing protein n=1 Tax=Vibrio ouci TaxID=2499078 RepID=A0A4Y8WK83_9VIBR|nr:STAS domain-containing protein [Vibrio ouci]TFH92698.1 STAS domain-containing protein [Vibrio ouci]
MSTSVSISQLSGVLVATVQVDLSSEVLDSFRSEVLNKVREHSIQGVLIDLSEVKSLDRMDMDALLDIVSTIEVMGRGWAFVGIRPGIAMALVNIGYETENMHCARDIDDGLAMIGNACDRQ